jgi:hypothetical protein
MNNKQQILKKLEQWLIYIFITRFSYKYWISIREQSKDGYGEKLCYCGHTYKCICGNLDKQCFKESVKRGSIILFDKNNGWKNVL